MKKNNDVSSRPLSFVKTPPSEEPSDVSRVPLSFVKTPPSDVSRVPLSFVKKKRKNEPTDVRRVPLSFVKKKRKNEPTSPGSFGPWPILPNSLVANAFKALLGACAASVPVATLHAPFGGVETVFNVVKLRALKMDAFEPEASRNIALRECFCALRFLAARLDSKLVPVADRELSAGWRRGEEATTTANVALRESMLRQARDLLSAAATRLKGERQILARLATAAIDFGTGRLAVGLTALDATARMSWSELERSVGKARAYVCWRSILETRDFLTALVGGTTLADYWRERSAFFASWASSVSATERRQAQKARSATRLLETDLKGAALALRKAAFGRATVLNREATAVYERTFGELPKRPSQVGAAIVALCIIALGLAAAVFGISSCLS